MIDYQLINENGYTFRFKASNNKSSKNILFIHGFATDSEYHDEVAQMLVENYNYYSLQLPGHGYSKIRHRSQLNPLFYAKYVADWIKQKGFENLILIGHSMGGGICTLVSNMVSDQLAKVVLVTPMNSSMWSTLKSLNILKIPSNNEEDNFKSKALLLHDYKKVYEDSSDSKIKDEVLYFLKFMKEFKILRKNMFSFKLKKELSNAEKKNPIKTLVILGKNDGIISYSKSYKRFSRLPNYTVKTFESSAHLPFIEDNDLYCRVILDFIENQN